MGSQVGTGIEGVVVSGGGGWGGMAGDWGMLDVWLWWTWLTLMG